MYGLGPWSKWGSHGEELEMGASIARALAESFLCPCRFWGREFKHSKQAILSLVFLIILSNVDLLVNQKYGGNPKLSP